MDDLLAFTKSQKLLTISAYSKGEAWIANVYVGVTDDMTLYFISPKDSKHSKLILENPDLVFSMAWFDNSNCKNRKGIQGKGVCHIVRNPVELATGIEILRKNFPDFLDVLTLEWIINNMWGTRMWKIKPTYIKYWDDEKYGDDESKEFTLT